MTSKIEYFYVDKLPNYNLSRSIPVDVKRTENIYSVSAKKTLGLEICGEGTTPKQAIEDMARLINKEYIFFSSLSETARLRGYAKKIKDRISAFIESERNAA